MLIALAVLTFFLGLLWHCWRLIRRNGRARLVNRIVDVVGGAGLFAVAAALGLKGLSTLPVSFWSVLPLFLIFLLFIDAVHSALRFHDEDQGQRLPQTSPNTEE